MCISCQRQPIENKSINVDCQIMLIFVGSPMYCQKMYSTQANVCKHGIQINKKWNLILLYIVDLRYLLVVWVPFFAVLHWNFDKSKMYQNIKCTCIKNPSFSFCVDFEIYLLIPSLNSTIALSVLESARAINQNNLVLPHPSWRSTLIASSSSLNTYRNTFHSQIHHWNKI